MTRFVLVVVVVVVVVVVAVAVVVVVVVFFPDPLFFRCHTPRFRNASLRCVSSFLVGLTFFIWQILTTARYPRSKSKR